MGKEKKEEVQHPNLITISFSDPLAPAPITADQTKSVAGGAHINSFSFSQTSSTWVTPSIGVERTLPLFVKKQAITEETSAETKKYILEEDEENDKLNGISQPVPTKTQNIILEEDIEEEGDDNVSQPVPGNERSHVVTEA